MVLVTGLHAATAVSRTPHLVPRSPDQIPQQRPGRAAIQGVITDETGRGLPAAEIVLKSSGREVARTVSSGDGVFRFADVAPGDYLLSVIRGTRSRRRCSRPGRRSTFPSPSAGTCPCRSGIATGCAAITRT